MSGVRLAHGGRIDRTSLVPFRFDGETFEGHPGDTLASALMAAGVRLVGRSFKYHRPRGLVAAGPEEPNGLVTVLGPHGREPNRLATMLELCEGLEVESQNRWPRLEADLLAVNGWLSPLFAAGFYYKTFMWPAPFWERVYEPLIRRAAGLGKADIGAAAPPAEMRHAHCDVLVVGAGLAGLSAAVAAAQAGARVILIEQDREAGGAGLVDAALATWRERALAALPGEVEVLTRTTAIGLYDQGVVAGLEHPHPASGSPIAHRLHVIRARRLVLATGAVERLIALPDNDRPGVMLAAAARAYVTRYGVAPGRDAVFFVTNDEAYASARDLAAAGVRIEAVVDPRPATPVARAALAAGLPVLNGFEIAGVKGRNGVRAVVARPVGGGQTRTLHTELLCLSGGYTPQTQLATQAGLTLRWDDGIAGFAGPDGGEPVACAGAAAGVFGRLEAARHGHAVGLRLAASLGFRGDTAFIAPEVGPRADGPISPLWEVKGPDTLFGHKAFVDLQNDVTADDMRVAAREGYTHVEHAKRYTTHGMGTDQGKIGGLVGAAVLAEARGLPVAAVGVSKPRPFVTPAPWAALAGAEVGAHFKPEKRLPLHDWHAEHGAVFVKIGLWLRPLVYSASGDTSWGPVLEEARVVRRSVGLCDVSSLGKIDVQGPDAGRFLDLIYANTFSTLPVGRARYGLMLREDGVVFDDGTTSRLALDHFIVTTTTAKAQDVLEHMELHHQTVWPDLDVQITPIADAWAQFALAGPRAREVLGAVAGGVDVSNGGFPFMAAAEATIAGIRGRLFRISFSGELAYEVAVPARHALAVWSALLKAGEPHGIRPYGLDALNLMRIEKGHVAGSELNGQTTAADLGLGKMLKKNGDFIGRHLVDRPGLTDPQRLQLVGLHPLNTKERLRNGAHLVSAAEPRRSQGYLTAACMASEGPHPWIGLALLEGGHGRHGERLIATSPITNETVAVEIVSPHRLDPENARVKA